MKKMWKMRKDSKAVSPVIATILMVAITVVLAAVLYVMVMGFGGPSTQTPTGSFVGTPTNITGGYKFSVGTLSTTTKWTDIKVVVSDNNVPQSAATVTLVTSGKYSAAGTLHATIYNLAANGNVNNGDYMIVGGTFTSTHTILVTLLFAPTGGEICHQSFTVP